MPVQRHSWREAQIILPGEPEWLPVHTLVGEHKRLPRCGPSPLLVLESIPLRYCRGISAGLGWAQARKG